MRGDHVATALAALGGAALIASLAFPWTARGAASSLPGYRVANLLLASRDTIPRIPWWTGAAFYLIPLAGALTWLALGLWGSTASRAYRVVAFLGIGVSMLLVGWIAMVRGISGLGVGAYAAFGGAVAVGCALVVGMHFESRSNTSMDRGT